MDITNLSDTEIAILTYALERFADDGREEDFVDGFIDKAEEMSGMITKEYQRRNLDWKMFSKYTDE